MTTDKQRHANRRNAERSTGPSEEGKLRSRENAVKTGAHSYRLLPGEDAAAFLAMKRGLYEQFQPEGTVWANLVDLLAVHTWRMWRVLNAEGAALSAAVLAEQAVRARRDAEKYVSIERTSEPGTALQRVIADQFRVKIRDPEAHEAAAQRVWELEAARDADDTVLGHVFVQDVLGSDFLSTVGNHISRIEGSFYRVLKALTK